MNTVVLFSGTTSCGANTQRWVMLDNDEDYVLLAPYAGSASSAQPQCHRTMLQSFGGIDH